MYRNLIFDFVTGTFYEEVSDKNDYCIGKDETISCITSCTGLYGSIKNELHISCLNEDEIILEAKEKLASHFTKERDEFQKKIDLLTTVINKIKNNG